MIVEDGSIVPGANSYTTSAYATAYHANMGNVAWAAIPSEADDPPPAAGVVTQESCLIQATQYMVGVYRLRWRGYRRDPTQMLDWPRIGVTLPDTASYYVDQRLSYTVMANIVPDPVQVAVSELALRASTQDLWPDLDQRTLKEKVGPIEVDYDRFSPQYRRFRQVDLLLNIFLDGTNGLTTRMVRGA